MSEQLLTIENLRIEYVMEEETVHAVNGISLSMNKCETLGLVGETGAGKNDYRAGNYAASAAEGRKGMLRTDQSRRNRYSGDTGVGDALASR